MSGRYRKLCVLFASIAESRALLEELLGAAEAKRAVARCLARCERVVDGKKNGRVLQSGGDEIMAVLDSAEDGMDAAWDMRARVDGLPPIKGIKAAVRIGYHFGRVVEADNSVSGDAVNVARQLLALARGGQIITTAESVAEVAEDQRRPTREIEPVTVEGRSELVHVREIPAAETEKPAAKSPARSAAPAQGAPRLRLRHGNVEITLDAGHPRATLGRDLEHDIVIRDPRASRGHGRIELRGDKFVLVDQSSNGTFVAFEGEAEFVLKGAETALLHNSGRLSFGHPWSATKQGEILEFELLGQS